MANTSAFVGKFHMLIRKCAYASYECHEVPWKLPVKITHNGNEKWIWENNLTHIMKLWKIYHQLIS